jgi:cysteine synthase A
LKVSLRMMVSPRHPTIVGKALIVVIWILMSLAQITVLVSAEGTNLDSHRTSTRMERGSCSTIATRSSSSNQRRNTNSNNNILPDVTGAIGKTPLVDLSRVARHYGIDPSIDGRILGKLEYLSPGGSKKDRIALSILEQARKDGTLLPGQTVVELTSGNTGTGLAIVCGVWGHPFVAVMSKGNSKERSRMMEALGARVVLVDQADIYSTEGRGVSGADLDLVEQAASEITESLGAFRADQFVKEANALAHYEGTGPELWSDSGDTITDFLDFVGTGGSFGGIASYLKEQSGGNVRCYIVEPENAAVLLETAPTFNTNEQTATSTTATTRDSVAAVSSSGCRHRIQGGGYMKSRDELPLIAPLSSTYSDENADENENNVNPLIDGYLTVTDEEAIRATRDLAKHEGIFAGYSAGANLVAAIKLLQQRRNHQRSQPDTVAILICDSGLKYMSTDLWE